MNSFPLCEKTWTTLRAAFLGLLLVQAAQAQIYVLEVGTGNVGEYNRDGTVVNAVLVHDNEHGAKSLAVAGSNLVIADQVKEAILQYSVSGQALTPSGIASAKPWAVAVSGSKVFVASPQTGTVGEYTLDGKTINAALIQGLKGPDVIAVSGSNIFVGSYDGTIGEYTMEGAPVNAALLSTGVQGAYGIAVAGSSIYVTNGAHGTVAEYSTEGKTVHAALITGLQSPLAVAVSGANLYIASNANGGSVSVYTTAGKLVNSALITGLGIPASIAVVAVGAEPVAVVHPGDPGTPEDHSKPPKINLPPRPRTNLPAVIVDAQNYGTENNWLAHHIALRITTLCYLALHPDAATVPDFKITAQVDAPAHTVHLDIANFSPTPITANLKPEYAWDAAGYAPLASQLLGANPPAPAGEIPPTPDLVSELLNLTGPRLAQADLRFSAQLAKTPAWSAGHEQAALLLVSLALRDRASTFTDYRQILCRATAHLSVAQALRQKQDATWAGNLADAGIRTLAGRETDALNHLTALAAQVDAPDAAKTWIAGLRVRATGDWQPIAITKETPLLSKIILAHVMADELTSIGAARRLGAAGDLPLVPDWGRCAMTNRLGVSVETGNTNAVETTQLEMQELANVLKIENAPAIDAHPGATFAQALQETVVSGPPTTLHIIGPDLFIDVTRRHLLAEMAATNSWLTTMLGDADGAKTYSDTVHQLFSDARLFELVPFTVGHLNYVKIFTDLGNAHRQWEPWEMPMGVIPDCYQLIYPDVHTIHAFYADGLPFGTAYELYYRQGSLANAQELEDDKHPEVYASPNPGVPKEKGDEMLKLAPGSFTAMQLASLSPPDVIQKSKPLWDYNLEPIFKFETDWKGYLHSGTFVPIGGGPPKPDPNRAPDNPDYTLMMQKQAALLPDGWFQIGRDLREEGKVDEAAEADRKAFDQGFDQVGMSNSVGPLVDYYHDHGRDDEAELVAKRAAEVYSEQGLMIYMDLLEKLGRLDEAEDYGKKIKERYGSSDKLIRLYAAHGDHFDLKQMTASTFPDGMIKTDLESLPPGPPTSGVQLTGVNHLMLQAGLRPGDIIVALDSYRVINTDQYTYLAGFNRDPNMTFIVWRKDRYLTIQANVPGRRFGVTLQTFRP